MRSAPQTPSGAKIQKKAEVLQELPEVDEDDPGQFFKFGRPAGRSEKVKNLRPVDRKVVGNKEEEDEN